MLDESLKALPEMLTAKQIAEHMQINTRTVQEWVNTGDLARIMIGKREYRIARQEFLRFLEAREKRG